MIRCLIVDDKPLAIDILKEYIYKTPFLELVHFAQNPIDALEYIRQHTVDVIFLDIQMPELNGIQFMKLLKGRSKVILTTAYSEYALEGFEHDVVDYLLKPVSFGRFYRAIEKVRKVIEMDKLNMPAEKNVIDSNFATSSSIFVKTEYKVQRIPIESILYIEAKQNYIAIVTGAERIMSLQNIKTIEQKLQPAKFLRVHKSFIVCLDKIESIERSRIRIGNSIIPIGESYRSAFFQKIGT